MAVVNLQARTGGSQQGEFKLLETDVYRAKIADVTMEEDRFAQPNADGARPMKLVIRWEVTEAGEEQDDDCVGQAVWQRFNPYYGTVKEGGPSKFMAFIDALKEQDLLPGFDPGAFDTAMLLNIEQKISVENYIKTMGDNAGKPGNKVLMVMPLKRAKKAKEAKPAAVPAGVVEEEDLPF